MALIAQAATLEARVPFLHFFDGFRTSHEVAKIEVLTEDDLRAHDRRRAACSRTAHGRCRPIVPCCAAPRRIPTCFSRPARPCNPFYDACPDIVQKAMDRFAALTGRAYHLFDYHGAPDAERVIVLMGSGCETAQETVDYLTAAAKRWACSRCDCTGRSTSTRFVAALPATVEGHRRARPHQGTRRPRRAAVPGCRDRAALRPAARRGTTKHAGGRRRTLRPVVEGVHARDGQGRVRQPGGKPSRRTISRSASTTT